MSGHVLCAVVAAVARLSPSLPLPLPVVLPLVAISLFVAIAVAIAITLAALIIALFDAHWCALSPPTAIRIGNDGRIGSSLVAAGAAWRQQRR